MILQETIYIDEFHDHVDGVHILTHWHNDHVKGLVQAFAHPVYCTLLTSILLKQKFPRVRTICIEPGTYISGLRIKILVLDANHLPGSIMLYLPGSKTLYTGDYRLSVSMLQALVPFRGLIHDLYVDGTYHSPDVCMLSQKQSVALFEKFLRRKTEQNRRLVIGLYHVGTCALLVHAGLKFCLDVSVSSSVRCAAETLYGPWLVSQYAPGVAILVHPKKYVRHCLDTVVIPCSLWFNCRGHHQYVREMTMDVVGQWRLNYTCHSDYYDNLYLQRFLGCRVMIPLNESRVSLACAGPSV